MAVDPSQAAAADLLSDAQIDEILDGAIDTVAVAGEAPEQAAPEPEDEADELVLPSFEADTTGLDFLDEPEPEPDDDEDEPDDDEPVEPAGEYDDPEVARLKAQNAKLQKQVKYQADLRAKGEQAKWRDEAARRFPLSDPEEIVAGSRRAMLRQAAAQHERVAKKIEPITKAMEAMKNQVIAEAKAEGRAQAEQAYGRPITGPGTPAVEQAQEPDLHPSKFKTFQELTLARVKAGKLNI